MIEKKKKKSVNFEKAMKDIKKALLRTHEILQTKNSYDYKGEEITHSSVLVVDHNIKDSLKASYVKKSKEQGRDLLDIILAKAFQLGYSAAKIEEDNDVMKKMIMQIGMKRLEEFGNLSKNDA